MKIERGTLEALGWEEATHPHYQSFRSEFGEAYRHPCCKGLVIRESSKWQYTSSDGYEHQMSYWNLDSVKHLLLLMLQTSFLEGYQRKSVQAASDHPDVEFRGQYEHLNEALEEISEGMRNRVKEVKP